MPGYRLYLYRRGTIVGRHDFAGSDDEGAKRIAEALFDACSDLCDEPDLWSGTRHIPMRPAYDYVSYSRLSPAAQEVVIQTEELIVRASGA